MESCDLMINAMLPQSKDQVVNKNTLHHYLPVRNRGNEFRWESVIGLVMKMALRMSAEKYDYETFVIDSKAYLAGKLGEEKFWSVLENMYFKHRDILNVSPEFHLFNAQKGQYTKSEERVAALFAQLLQDHNLPEFETRLNFLEKDILSLFKSKINDDHGTLTKEYPYIPFIADNFQRDFTFLARRPHYLLAEIKHFLTFYAFLYCAQLALCIDDWSTGLPPAPKPLFFIMDTEKASAERTHIKRDGFKSFQNSTVKLFPILSMLENLQPDEDFVWPLWKLYSELDKSPNYEEVVNRLKVYSQAFKEQRELNSVLTNSNELSDVIQDLMTLALEQFESLKTTRGEINDKYMREVQGQFGKHFIQTRGRAGRVLVLSQDYLILLTNLVVGENERMQLHDLTDGFKSRGVFFDKQSEQALINFYERIGNIERMSDSGDAVYVRKTV